MAFITFKNDKPRQLRFGFNSMAYLKSAHKIEKIQDLFSMIESGDLTMVSVLIEACLVGDNDNLDTKKLNFMLDDYMQDHGFDSLMKIVKETVEDSAIFKEGNKKKSTKQK
jgi:hypothetical protein